MFNSYVKNYRRVSQKSYVDVFKGNFGLFVFAVGKIIV